jgi:hypothetical protein
LPLKRKRPSLSMVYRCLGKITYFLSGKPITKGSWSLLTRLFFMYQDSKQRNVLKLWLLLLQHKSNN